MPEPHPSSARASTLVDQSARHKRRRVFAQVQQRLVDLVRRSNTAQGSAEIRAPLRTTPDHERLAGRLSTSVPDVRMTTP